MQSGLKDLMPWNTNLRNQSCFLSFPPKKEGSTSTAELIINNKMVSKTMVCIIFELKKFTKFEVTLCVNFFACH